MALPLFIRGMLGLGDNIFARPFVREQLRHYPAVYLSTSWPELYEDMTGLRFVCPNTKLRTQAKNVDAQHTGRWHTMPLNARLCRVSYGHGPIRTHGTIARAIEACFPQKPAAPVWDLPVFPAPVGRGFGNRPLAVVRPVTERTEWHNAARGPLPEYVARIAAALMDTHHVVSVADLAPGAEWLTGEAPPAHTSYHAGELDVRALLGLVQRAAVVVGGVGWIVPAGIAARVPTFVIHGGMGAHNAPAVITDPRFDLSNYGFALPERFCTCATMKHTCPKKIPDLATQWNRFASPRCLPLLPPDATPAPLHPVASSHGGTIPESAICR